ncbi:MAG: NAD-dependent epimerase/dehydratase family protein [bacterium]|nr:NAD-dependent epimerase/dehydratase family protein [bacterium]
MKKKIFITGISGYFGRCLCKELLKENWCGDIYGIDIKKSDALNKKIFVYHMDMNSADLGDLLKELQPDVLIHLAFIVNPIHNERLMTHINIDGTKNVLQAAEESGIPQVMVASSGVAYGAWPDNPVPLKETDPIRKHPTFRYAKDKAVVEELCARYMERNPHTVFSIIRPCIVYGRNVDNYISNILALPLVPLIKGYDTAQQFVHEDDVAGSILAILKKRGRGAFNLAPGDALRMSEVVKKSGKVSISLPFGFARAGSKLLWFLRFPILKFPPSFIDYVCYPWLLDNKRIRDEMGYTFKYSSSETLDVMLRADCKQH